MPRFKTVEQAKAHLDILIDELEAKVGNPKQIDVVKSRMFLSLGTLKLIQNVKKSPQKWNNKLTIQYLELGQLAADIDDLFRFRKSRDMQLMLVNTKYLLLPADENLIIPAGFLFKHRVFKLPKGCVKTDTLPKRTNLIPYDLEDIITAIDKGLQ